MPLWVVRAKILIAMIVVEMSQGINIEYAKNVAASTWDSLLQYTHNWNCQLKTKVYFWNGNRMEEICECRNQHSIYPDDWRYKWEMCKLIPMYMCVAACMRAYGWFSDFALVALNCGVDFMYLHSIVRCGVIWSISSLCFVCVFSGLRSLSLSLPFAITFCHPFVCNVYSQCTHNGKSIEK